MRWPRASPIDLHPRAFKTGRYGRHVRRPHRRPALADRRCADLRDRRGARLRAELLALARGLGRRVRPRARRAEGLAAGGAPAQYWAAAHETATPGRAWRKPQWAKYSKVEIDGHLLIVTINRPEVYNALHPMANQELSDVFDEFAANPELWVAIVTGAGDKAFSAGNDLKYHAELRAKTGGRPHSPAQGLRRPHQPPRPRQAGDRRRQRRRHGRRLRDRARLRHHHRLRPGEVRAARAARRPRRRRRRHAAPVAHDPAQEGHGHDADRAPRARRRRATSWASSPPSCRTPS